MTDLQNDDSPQAAPAERSRSGRGLLNTIPIVLAGSMAMTFGVTGQAADAEQDRRAEPPAQSELGLSIRASLAAAHEASTREATSTGETTTAAAAPARYTVSAGDTVSSIAGRFGLATASVLAMNGLGWKSVIFPGQVLTLVKSAPVPATSQVAPPAATPGSYVIVAGDTVGKIATRFGVSTQALLAANGLNWSSIIFAGRTLVVPGIVRTSSVTKNLVAAPPPTAAPSAPRLSNTAHVIMSGETIAGIAASYGVTIQAVLNANGLGWSSIIYSGRTLTIPGVPVATTAGAGITALTEEMAGNARTILAVGRSLGVSDYGLVISLATAMQESSLRNLNYGDRDSLGLFQQRPSTGWGTPEQVTDPTYAARLFFGGPSGPNRGVTNGLLDISGWKSMTVTQAAQSVQRSAFPDAYAQWESSAWAWLDQLR